MSEWMLADDIGNELVTDLFDFLGDPGALYSDVLGDDLSNALADELGNSLEAA